MALPNWPQTGAEAKKPRRKIAIIGFASSSRHLAPWLDPAWEIWGLNTGYAHFERRPDRWFELHQGDSRTEPSVPDYFADLVSLMAQGCPLYVAQTDPALPGAVPFPLALLQEASPPLLARYFTSTIAYLIALALAEEPEEIGIYGVDCTIGSEYEAQKPCVEAWLMYAAGKGVQITVPSASALFKSPNLYGFEPQKTWPKQLVASEGFIKDRIDTLKAHYNETESLLYQYQGAIKELETLWTFAESKARGAEFPGLEGDNG